MLAIRLRTTSVSASGAAGTATWTSSSKTTSPKLSVGSRRPTRSISAALADSLAGHRAGAVEDDLQGARRAGARGLRRRGGELEEHGDLVARFDRDDVEVERGVEMHARTVAGASG